MGYHKKLNKSGQIALTNSVWWTCGCSGAPIVEASAPIGSVDFVAMTTQMLEVPSGRRYSLVGGVVAPVAIDVDAEDATWLVENGHGHLATELDIQRGGYNGRV